MSSGPTDMGNTLGQRIFEHHGGAVRVGSDGERGATFAFIWPKEPTPRDSGT